MNKFGIFLFVLALMVIAYAIFYVWNPFKTVAQHNDEIRKADIAKISRALEAYDRDYGHYPAYDQDSLEIVVESEKRPWGSSWVPYLENLPRDPSVGRKYVYWSDKENNFQTYRLYASLEDSSADRRSCYPHIECPNVPGKFLCGQNLPCNLGVTSGNVSP